MSINYAALGSDALALATTSRLEIRSYIDAARKKRQFDRGFVAPINPDSIKVTFKNTLAGQVGLNSIGASLSLASNQAEEISFKLILTDSSIFHYSGRNVFTLMNNYEADNYQNIGYLTGQALGFANQTFNPLTTTWFKSKVEQLHSGPASQFTKGSFPLLARDGHVTHAIERFLNLTTQAALTADKGPKAPYLGLVWGRVFNRPGEVDDKKGKFIARKKRVYPCYLESVDVNYTHFTRDGRVLRAELDCVFKEDSTESGE